MHLDIKKRKKNTFNSLPFLKRRPIAQHIYIFWVMLSSVILLRRKLRTGKYFRLFFRHLQLTNFGSVFSELWNLKTQLLLLHLVDQLWQKMGRPHSTLR